MHQRTVEQVGDGREADVRMRQHVDAAAGRQHGRPHLVEEDERADEAGGARAGSTRRTTRLPMSLSRGVSRVLIEADMVGNLVVEAGRVRRSPCRW